MTPDNEPGPPIADRREPAAGRWVIDWGHLVFLGIIGAAVSWYLLDTLSVSTDIDNVLIVVPLSVMALALCLLVLPQCFARRDRAPKPAKTGGIVEIGSGELRSNDLRQLALIGSMAVALGVYVFVLDLIGFDVATWLFALVAMVICGERRWLALVVYPLVVAAMLIAGFQALLPYPMYTAIL